MCLGLPLPGFCRLGLAYAGSNREDVLTLLLPVMGDSKSSMEVRRECWTFRGGREGALRLSTLCVSSEKSVCVCTVCLWGCVYHFSEIFWS